MEAMKFMKKGVQIFSLRGKRALVTGGTGNLGTSMTSILAEAGAHILVNSRSQERSEAQVKRLIDAGYSAEPAVFDVTSRQDIDRYFAGCHTNPLHILINNAYSGGGGNVDVSKAEEYVESYDVTVIAAHNLLKAALPALRKSVQQDGGASVINLSTMYAMISPDQRIYESASGVNPPFYGAAKAALLQWTRYAACEFGAEGIRVNSISPGPFPSELVQKGSPAFIEKLANKVPMGRVGQSAEIKGPILFLASSASSFVNGANIVVDGGWTCW
jgi:NAD(P)-dependent dehydrogenase (short-subunit alcohol dehydrogenase family)